MVRRVCQRQRQRQLLPSTPVIRSLVVQPSSGNPPYRLTVDVIFDELIDGINYTIEAGFLSKVGFCSAPTENFGTHITMSNSLLLRRFYIYNSAVAIGDCLTFQVRIKNIITQEIVSTEIVSIDNV